MTRLSRHVDSSRSVARRQHFTRRGCPSQQRRLVGLLLPAPPLNDPLSFAGRAAQQRGRDELALRSPLTCAGAIAIGLPLDRPNRARRRPACRPAIEVAAGPAMLHREHHALPRLDDSHRQRHWRCREHHNPIPPTRRSRRRRAHPRHVCGHRSELAGELHRLAGTRRLKSEAQAHDLPIRERWAGKDNRWTHGLHPPRLRARRRYRSCVIQARLGQREAFAESLRNELGARAGADLLHRVARVRADRVVGDPQLFGYLGPSTPERHEADDLTLAV